MKVDSSFNPFPDERIHSMLPLNNGKYLCAVESGSLQLIDITEKTAKLYANKYKGKQVQCIVAFPGYNEDLFPLALIKEWKCVVILNIKLKRYIKVSDIDTTGEYGLAYNQRLCFCEKVNNEYSFITYHQENTMSKFVIP